MTKALLIVGATCTAVGAAITTGLVNPGNADWTFVALPLGAILLGTFGISRIFEHETALYDVEHESQRESQSHPPNPEKVGTPRRAIHSAPESVGHDA